MKGYFRSTEPFKAFFKKNLLKDLDGSCGISAILVGHVSKELNMDMLGYFNGNPFLLCNETVHGNYTEINDLLLFGKC